MNISRNGLCPCGSGKKYKRCCAEIKTYTLSSAKQRVEDHEAVSEELQTELDEQVKLGRLATEHKLRARVLEKQGHINAYKRIRQMQQKIQDDMIDFYEEGEFVQEIDMTELDKNREDFLFDDDLELLDFEYDLTTELGIRVFYDELIFKRAPFMNCITEVFIAQKRYQTPEEIEFLHSMLNSTIGLFEVIEVEKELAYVTLENVFTNEIIKIIDIGLSGNKKENVIGSFIYLRIITYGEFSFGTGLNFPFHKNDYFIHEFIDYHKKNYHLDDEVVRMIRLYNWQTSIQSGYKAVITNPFQE